jgi:S-adenosylmethionine synthetase
MSMGKSASAVPNAESHAGKDCIPITTDSHVGRIYGFVAHSKANLLCSSSESGMQKQLLLCTQAYLCQSLLLFLFSFKAIQIY